MLAHLERRVKLFVVNDGVVPWSAERLGNVSGARPVIFLPLALGVDVQGRSDQRRGRTDGPDWARRISAGCSGLMVCELGLEDGDLP